MTPIQIFVNTPSGTPKHIAISIFPGVTTGFELKQLLTDRIGGDPRWIRLLYAGRSIEDNDIVTDRKVGAENTVHALMRILSCQQCPNCDTREQPQIVPKLVAENNNSNNDVGN